MESGVPPPREVAAADLDTGATTTQDGSSRLPDHPLPPSFPELPPSAKVPAVSPATDEAFVPPLVRSPTELATAIQRVDSLTVEAVAAVSTAIRPIHSPALSTESLGEALAAPSRPRPRQGVKAGVDWSSRLPVAGRLSVVGEKAQFNEAVSIEGSTMADTDGNDERHPPHAALSPPHARFPPASEFSPVQGCTGSEDAAAADEDLVAAIAEMKASPLAARTADALVNAVRRVDSMTPATADEVVAALNSRPHVLPVTSRASTKESCANGVADAPPVPAGASHGDAAAGSVSADGGNGCIGGSGSGGGGGSGHGGGRLPPKPPSDARPGHRRGDTLVHAIVAADDATLRAAAAVANAIERVDTEDEVLDAGATSVAYPSVEGVHQ